MLIGSIESSVISIILTEEEATNLDSSMRGSGGMQGLFLALKNSRVGNTQYLTRVLAERVVRYFRRYRQGGFQQRLKPLAERLIPWVDDPATQLQEKPRERAEGAMLTQRENKTSLVLHGKLIDLMASNLSQVLSPSLSTKPLELQCAEPLPQKLRIYAYHATNPPGERSIGDYKIQLMVPGQKRGPNERGYFKFEQSWRVLLLGYVQEYDVIVFWDPSLHNGFPFSKNLQVHPGTVYSAAIHGSAFQSRAIKKRGNEEVFATRAGEISQGIRQWLERRAERLAR